MIITGKKLAKFYRRHHFGTFRTKKTKTTFATTEDATTRSFTDTDKTANSDPSDEDLADPITNTRALVTQIKPSLPQWESASSMGTPGAGQSIEDLHYYSKSNKNARQLGTTEEIPENNNNNNNNNKANGSTTQSDTEGKLRDREDFREEKSGPSSRSLRVLVRKTDPSSRSFREDLCNNSRSFRMPTSHSSLADHCNNSSSSSSRSFRMPTSHSRLADHCNNNSSSSRSFRMPSSHSRLAKQDSEIGGNNNSSRSRSFRMPSHSRLGNRSWKQSLWKKRCKHGKTFRRFDAVQEESIVMFTQSASDRPWEAKLSPGVYQLTSLIDFPDMGIPAPRHATIPVKQSDWQKANDGTTGSGTLALSPEAIQNTVVPVEFASNLLLEFYGCTLIDSRNTQEITLRDEHVIQDFTYSKDYFDRYARHRGGLEVHDFAHLDCPMDGLESSGLFVLGKWNDTGDALFVTAFRVPQWHALFVPGGVIHTNDYLCGTWRTMLSWTSAEPIDHVHLVDASAAGGDDSNQNTPLHIEPCDCGPDLWRRRESSEQ